MKTMTSGQIIDRCKAIQVLLHNSGCEESTELANYNDELREELEDLIINLTTYTMKIVAILIITISFLTTGLAFIGIRSLTRPKPKPIINLPKEWQTISTSNKFPDLLIGHLSPKKDTLYLTFDN